MENKVMKFYSKAGNNIILRAVPGHFATSHSHINYYVDMTGLKTRRSEAAAVGKAFVQGLPGETVVDTVCCLDGCEVIGAYVAQQLSEAGFNTTNTHKTSYVISPEFDSSGQMVVRENIKPMIKDKHVLVVLATAMSGHTIEKSLRCIESYGGIVEGISVIFGVVSEIEGHPVNAVFSVDDLPDFRLSDPKDCPDCKNGVKLDAIVNSYGYTPL